MSYNELNRVNMGHIIGSIILLVSLAILAEVNGGTYQEDQIKAFAAEFRGIDTDSNGKLSADEIRNWVVHDDLNAANFQIKDKNSDGQLTRDEYHLLTWYNYDSRDRTFTQADSNGDDVLSQEEYISGINFPEVLTEFMFNDEDGDSNIDWTEFQGYAWQYGDNLPATIELAEAQTTG